MPEPRRFEYSDAKSEKFWEIIIADRTVSVRYGRIGKDGQMQTKAFATPAVVMSAAEKQVAEKGKKGYCEVTGGKTAPTPPSPRPTNAAKKRDSLRKLLASLLA